MRTSTSSTTKQVISILSNHIKKLPGFYPSSYGVHVVSSNSLRITLEVGVKLYEVQQSAENNDWEDVGLQSC